VTDDVIPFDTADGIRCNLVHVGSDRPAGRGPVLLVHGAGVRANVFRAPVQTNLVDALVERGYDVWLENWRASMDVAPNPWTLDRAAVYDHPAAVQTVLAATGASELKAIVHCQGSTSFTMSAVAGLLPQVTTIVSNAVSLHPVIPPWATLKIKYLAPLVARLTDYVDPHWGDDAPTLLAKVMAEGVRLWHHECSNDVCKMVSFTYGSGSPALWRHENLNGPTHEWLRSEFGFVPLTFFRQMAACVRAQHLVSIEGLPDLPRSFVGQPPKTDARFALFTGSRNECFLPASQRRSFQYLDGLRPGYHTLHELPAYSHLDVFMGKNASRDVFPMMLSELER
jgi:pimeloyl-ACP methyl ester carboxylesterase